MSNYIRALGQLGYMLPQHKGTECIIQNPSPVMTKWEQYVPPEQKGFTGTHVLELIPLSKVLEFWRKKIWDMIYKSTLNF